MKKTTTLAIETSCDDTSLALVSREGNRFRVEKMVSHSQVKDHQQYGGVVPEIASRLHSEKILAVLHEIGREALTDIDSISVTVSPGLPGSLLVGKSVASTLAHHYDKPLLKINHIHGHVLSVLLERSIDDISFPMVVLSVSGGHNDLYLVTIDGVGDIEGTACVGPFAIRKLGKSLDDAAGEAFDKASRMLGGPYPGGAWIGKQASMYTGDPEQLFSRSFLSKDSFDFSFSGVKSQVWREVEKLKAMNAGKQDVTEVGLTIGDIQRLAFEFQEAVDEVLAKKLVRAGEAFGAKSLALVGGVSANTRLREYIHVLLEQQLDAPVFLTPAKFAYCMDNAGMIGVVGLLDDPNTTD